jgi:PhoH-like ATPase
MSEDQNKKIFVLDTSVLLYDKNCIFNLKDNNIIIPMIVLEELDKFKSREGILGENSRFFNRFLDEIRSQGSLYDGIDIQDGLNIRVESNNDWEGLESLDKNCNDNKIIATVNYVSKFKSEGCEVILITKDINLRIKCDAAGIKANDYYADYEFIKEKDLFKGYRNILCEKNLIDAIYSNGRLSIDNLDINIDLVENECIILKDEMTNASALAIKKGNDLVALKNNSDVFKKSGIEPKNKEQRFAMNMLLDEKISLVTLTGIPGSGKTFLTLMSALKEIEREKKKRIIFTRPIQTVGKDIGFLPGDLNEKMSPWLSPIVDNFRNQFGDLTYFEMMMEKGQIDVAPLSHIRGRSFNDAIIIVDEAQNATVHELKTVITRTGKNSKIVLLGDIDQVDLPYIDKYSNGLTIIIEKLKNESITGHINFEKGYRSELANIASQLL